ncbi:hypothetical protein G9272_16860 [Streptomyces asoensis]|uniref:Uncharacterized protein n=1 Tax=Streptomyces asoensis TaxID=249586 RepID=A0A6M4WN09_9ACTN|nr:hypothetical protein [Streptomyces asoensis]QJT01774.1 hypothetical protein G9272_16860 [Streptomyces asoensis]
MGLFSGRAKSARAYPAAGTTVTGPVGRFLRSKTTGARAAGRAAQSWEDADRANERQRRGPYAN